MKLSNRPILMTTAITIAAGSMRDPADKYALAPPMKEPLFLDEIRIDYIDANDNVLAVNDVRIEFFIGNHSLTHLPVAITALNTSFNPSTMTNENGVVFKLKKPMYLNPDDILTPRVYNKSTHDVTMQITYACRRADSGIIPSEIWYPYITSFYTPQFSITTSTNPFVYESAESDLVNPYDVPLYVDRIVGMIHCDSSITTQIGAIMNVTMNSSKQAPLVRDPVPFNMLFNIQDFTWRLNGILDAHEFYQVQISYDDNDGQYLTSAINNVFLSTTLIGYRQMNTPNRVVVPNSAIRPIPQKLPPLPQIQKRLPLPVPAPLFNPLRRK